MAKGSRDRGGNITYPEVQNMLAALGRKVSALAEDQVANPDDSPCQPIRLSNEKDGEIFSEHYTVQVCNEFVYVTGDNGVSGDMSIYALLPDNTFLRVDPSKGTGSIDLKATVLQGRYLYGVARDDSQNFLVIMDVGQPNASVSAANQGAQLISKTDLGDETRALDVQGKYAYVACTTSIRVVDVSVPGAPVVVAIF